MKTPRALLALALSALLMAACRSVVDTHLNPDGSGELRTSVVYSAQEKENFESAPGNEGKSICDNLKENIPPGATLTEEQREGETYCVTTRTFDNLDDLRQLYSHVGNVKVNDLKFDLGRLVFDVDVDLTERNSDNDVADEWRLTLPGALGDHNADQVDGQTLIWEVPPGVVSHLHAECAVGLSLVSLGGTGLIILVCILGVVVIGGGAAVILQRRRTT